MIVSGFVLLVLAGCSSELKPSSIEDVALVGIMGIDYVDEVQMKLTLSVPQPSETTPSQIQTYTTVTSMTKQGIVDLSAKADKEIRFNGLRVVMLNEEFARSGRGWEVIEHLYRNSMVGGGVYVVVVKDSAEEVLRGEYPEKPRIVTYMNDLLKPKKHNMFSPFTTIHDYVYMQTNPVLDTITPFLEKNNSHVEIKGIATFKGEKMISMLTRDQGKIIQALKGASTLPASTFILEEDPDKLEQVVIDFVDSEVNIQSNRNVDSPSVDIVLKVRGSVFEYEGPKDLSKGPEFSKLEEELEATILEETTTLLEELRELEVDPVGISEYFRMHHYGEWTEGLSDQITKNVTYNVDVQLHILGTGTLR